jgi:hypothetical protein
MKMSQCLSQVGPPSSEAFTSSGVEGATFTGGAAGAMCVTGFGSASVRRQPVLPRDSRIVAQMGMIARRTLRAACQRQFWGAAGRAHCSDAGNPRGVAGAVLR